MYYIADHDSFHTKHAVTIAKTLTDIFLKREEAYYCNYRTEKYFLRLKHYQSNPNYKKEAVQIAYRTGFLKIYLKPFRNYGFTLIGRNAIHDDLVKSADMDITPEAIRDCYDNMLSIEMHRAAYFIVHPWMMLVDAYEETQHGEKALELVRHYRSISGLKV